MPPDEPRRRLDPLALAVLGGAALLAAGIALYVLFSASRDPAAERPGRIAALRQELRNWLQELREPTRAPQPPAAKPAPAAPPAAQSAKPPAKVLAPAQPAGRLVPEPGRSWRYHVQVEPQLWREITLTYRTVREGGTLGVQTEFQHANGKSNFHLGRFAPNHPSHANVRFPGFFMHAAYIELPLEPGQRLSWQWPWQLADGRTREGRIKRYEGRVAGWENIKVPAGLYSAARIEATLQYVDEGKVQASAKETLWYAPKVFQVVKIVREGRTPDEGASRIVAELAEFR